MDKSKGKIFSKTHQVSVFGMDGWMDGCSVTVQALKTTMLMCACVCVCVCVCDHLTTCCQTFYDWALARRNGNDYVV